MTRSETPLRKRRCEACEGGRPMPRENVETLMNELHDGWSLAHDGKRLERTFTFDAYPPAAAFVARVAELAEVEGHHPDILLTYGKATVTWWTHTADGVTGNDLICAAKCDAITEPQE